MRFYYSTIFFILLSISVNASWETYQNDLRNSGFSDEIGYFPLETSNFTNDELGMEFQPLVADLNNDGKNEIAIFSNNSLIIFNPQLEILSSIQIGGILGQPTLFEFDKDNFIEVVFNARQNSNDYFFVYQYNKTNLTQEFNITLPYEANFSGIKCVNINGTNSCVFKDKKNFVHIVDMDSRTDGFYNTSAYNESRQTVPAIGDLDNDGSLEAIFWFNQDNSDGYGFLAFDLVDRNVKWTVDNIFNPLILGTERIHQLYELKGQPVLANLNNDNKLEIAASVFYDDKCSAPLCDDWYTELFVYNSNGTKSFSVCEVGNLGCNNAIGGDQDRWEGTNPFVFDYDKNNIDDVCFIKDVKVGNTFSYMALNCYNYSGGEIARVNLTKIPDGIKGTAMAADMNNDGKKEIMTIYNIYLLNGTSIFNTRFLNTSNPIAVDIDGNNGLDLIWTRNYQTKVFLDNNNYTIDLAVFESDINFFKYDNAHVNISVKIRNIGKVKADNIKVVIYNTETLENNTAIVNLRGNSYEQFDSILALKDGDRVLVSVDYDNEIDENDETNNFATKDFNGLPYVFVSSNVEPSNINSEFQDFIKDKLNSAYYTDKESEADVKVYIGKYNPFNQNNNVNNLPKYHIGYDSGNIIYNDEIGVNPYSGLVFGLFNDDLFTSGKVTIMVVGNEIEGEIAGVKEFIKNQALLLSTKTSNSIFIDDENIDAVKVYDYLHLGGNSEHYNADNEQFRKIVRNALNDEMFNVFDKNLVSSNGITLRLRNLKPNISSDYLEYLNSIGVPVEMPVVLSHGLFSNLTTWEVLGAELSNTGRDTWLIEITGGPGQDCNDCIDYSFFNLTDIFVPALLNGVLNFTNKDKIQYVGFSNGCRAALDSLERGQFDSSKVETFVAVGCPGGFEGINPYSNTSNVSSLGSDALNLFGQNAINNARKSNLNHISIREISLSIFDFPKMFQGTDTKISTNLFTFYYNISSQETDQQPGKDLNIKRLGIIEGDQFRDDDIIVFVSDQKYIYDNINSNDKVYIRFFGNHLTMPDKQGLKRLVRKIINNESFSFYEKTINIKEQVGS